jgi:hypothetical protein
MTRATVDDSMDGLPMSTVKTDTPTDPSAPDKRLDDGPTTMNGLLASREQSLNDRVISAEFANEGDAAAARTALIDSGVAEAAISIVPHASSNESLRQAGEPEDKTLVGRIREAIAPLEINTAARDAVRHDYAILEVRPTAAQVNDIVRLISSMRPVRFDADLERWRNNG